MAYVTLEGLVKVATNNGYTDKIQVLHNGRTGTLYIGLIHVPPTFIGRTATLQLNFLDE